MPQVPANRLMIEYAEHGPKDGPAIVMIMGLAGQMTFWPDTLVADLAKAGFRVVTFDNRDIGLTTKVHGINAPHPVAQIAARVIGRNLAPYTLHDMVNDTLGLMDALEIRKAHIVGVSMGGMIGQLLSGTHPDRVLSLTSIMSGTLNPLLPGPSLRLIGPLFLNRPKDKSRDALIERAVAMWSLIRTNDPDADHSELRAKIAGGFDRSYYPAGVRRQLAAILATGDLRPHVRKIKAPTLVIHGSKDPLAPLAGGRDSARNIRGSRLEIIDGMAHDLPGKFLPRIAGLIVDHARAAAGKPSRTEAA